MLAFLGGLILAVLAIGALLVVIGAFAAAKCHNSWVEFLTGSDKPKKQVPNPYYYHPDGTPAAPAPTPSWNVPTPTTLSDKA